MHTQKPRNRVVLRKFDVSDAIECINLLVEVFHCFDSRLIWDFTGSVNPKTTLTNKTIITISKIKVEADQCEFHMYKNLI